jgi:hypothetical protein
MLFEHVAYDMLLDIQAAINTFGGQRQAVDHSWS